MSAATRTHAPDSLVALADRCVQCGLCLPVCPTYGFEQLETESPRGRIALSRAWALELIPVTSVGDTHLDHCLGCGNCEAVCPAGVEYGALLADTRGRQRKRRDASVRQRGMEALVTRPRLLSLLVGLYRRARPLLPRRLKVLPAPPSPTEMAVAPTASDPSVRAMALFTGCIAGPYELSVRAALTRLCEALSIPLAVPTDQTCCGALHAHAGNTDDAARLSERNQAAFAGHAQVITLASGCHGAVAAAVDGEAVDALAILDAQRERLAFKPCPERVALHLPCTQRNVSGTVPAVRRLLARIPDLTVIEIDAGYGCCGAAGSQMLTDPERANDYRKPLLGQLAASGATRLISANIGCRLHLANGTTLPVQHPLELLAECLVTPDSATVPAASPDDRAER